MTIIDEVRISCLKGNLKTSPAMSVHFLSLFQSKRGEFFYCRQVACCFFFSSETYDSKFEFWINPTKYWNWNQTHWWAFSPCISTIIKYTVSTSQSTCFIETSSSRGLFPYLGTDHENGYEIFFFWKHFYKHIRLRKHFFSNIIFVQTIFSHFFWCSFYLCLILPLPY